MFDLFVAMSKLQYRTLVRRQLDLRLLKVREAGVLEIPRGGWTKSIREALGMSASTLGRRIGMSQPAVSQLESSEGAGTITLASLRKLADGLGCEVAYVLLPREPLEDMVERQARTRARRIVGSISESMMLEGQDVSERALLDEVDFLTQTLVREPDRGFWDAT